MMEITERMPLCDPFYLFSVLSTKLRASVVPSSVDSRRLI
jgi:hypothetical protein